MPLHSFNWNVLYFVGSCARYAEIYVNYHLKTDHYEIETIALSLFRSPRPCPLFLFCVENAHTHTDTRVNYLNNLVGVLVQHGFRTHLDNSQQSCALFLSPFHTFTPHITFGWTRECMPFGQTKMFYTHEQAFPDGNFLLMSSCKGQFAVFFFASKSLCMCVWLMAFSSQMKIENMYRDRQNQNKKSLKKKENQSQKIPIVNQTQAIN